MTEALDHYLQQRDEDYERQGDGLRFRCESCGWTGTQEEALEVWNDDATEIDYYFCWDCGGDYLAVTPEDIPF